MKLDSSAITLTLGALVLAALAYWFFFTGTGNSAPITVVTTGSAAQTKFQSLVGELEPISFNTDIFADPRFTALVDLATPITPETSGRPDPFAAVPGVASQ